MTETKHDADEITKDDVAEAVAQDGGVRRSKSRDIFKLMDAAFWAEGMVSFRQEPDHEGEIVPLIEFHRDLWEDFGSPDTITVTIRPGNRLNRT